MLNQLKRKPRSQGLSVLGPRSKRERERERGGEREHPRPGSFSLSLSLSLALRVEYGEDPVNKVAYIRIALETNRVTVFNKARTTVFSYPTNWNLNLNIQIIVTFNLKNSVLCEQTREECYIS